MIGFENDVTGNSAAMCLARTSRENAVRFYAHDMIGKGEALAILKAKAGERERYAAVCGIDNPKDLKAIRQQEAVFLAQIENH
ncbi:Uncharacterised protein [uncultured archaeon]|nr:Uncharacterised protein [uncultured archaeon]